MFDMKVLAVLVISYCLGSIPFGLLIGKGVFRIDLRQYGSRNIGATNAYRTIGMKAALPIFLCDAAKGAAGVLLAQSWLGIDQGIVLAGIGAIAGHNWSIFLGGQGGKGVATGLGVIVAMFPQVSLTVFLLWLAITLTTRYVSLASIIAAAAVPVLVWLQSASREYLVFSVLAAAFVIFRHRENIKRLLSGTELKIEVGKGKKGS